VKKIKRFDKLRLCMATSHDRVKVRQL